MDTQNAMTRTVLSKSQYDASFDVKPTGLARSHECTSWQLVPMEQTLLAPVDLNEGARKAALNYVRVIQSISFGLLGSRKDSQHNGLAIYVRPLNWMLMGFSPLQQDPNESNAWFMSVEKGFFHSKYAKSTDRGWIYFRWHRKDDSEHFETEVRNYTSRLVGKRAYWIARTFYIWTQMVAHRYVSWRFHMWVKSHRDMLLTGTME